MPFELMIIKLLAIIKRQFVCFFIAMPPDSIVANDPAIMLRDDDLMPFIRRSVSGPTTDLSVVKLKHKWPDLNRLGLDILQMQQ